MRATHTIPPPQVPKTVCALLELHVCQHTRAPAAGVTAAGRRGRGAPQRRGKVQTYTNAADPGCLGNRQARLTRGCGQAGAARRSAPESPRAAAREMQRHARAAERRAPWPGPCRVAACGALIAPCAARLQSRSSGCTFWQACGRGSRGRQVCVSREVQFTCKASRALGQAMPGAPAKSSCACIPPADAHAVCIARHKPTPCHSWHTLLPHTPHTRAQR